MKGDLFDSINNGNSAQNNSKFFYGWIIVTAAMYIYAVGPRQDAASGIGDE